jgi:DNA-binding response OmpR family regulator
VRSFRARRRIGKPQCAWCPSAKDRPVTEEARTILVVEDEDNIALAIEYVMRSEGYAVSRVANGAEALPSIERSRPDVVLLDVMLPVVSGYEICEAVRKNPDLATVKILMMTARGNSLESGKCLALGADGFISKPFALGDMKSEVRRLLHVTA